MPQADFGMLHSSRHYNFAGTCLVSGIALPELPRADKPTATTLRLGLTEAPLFPVGEAEWSHVWRDADGAAVVYGARVAENYFLRFPGVCEARLATDGHIEVWPDPATDNASLRHMVLDQILPRALAQQGHLMSHGGMAMLGEGRCILIVGDTGMGKSTLCAALANAGVDVLTDDCLRLDVSGSDVHARATYPGLRLLLDSLAALYPEMLPPTTPMAHYSDKQRLLHMPTREQPALPVIAVFVLQPPTGREIRAERLAPGPACMALVANSFQLDPGDMDRVAALLRQAATATARVPVYAFAYPRDYARLPEVVKTIRDLAG